MKRNYQWIFIMLAGLLVLAAFMHLGRSTKPTEFFIYVSTKGNDSSGMGTIEKPYLTVEKARDSARSISKESYSEIIIYLREGEYFTPQTIVFGPEDSGTSTCPVTYCSYPGEVAIITGAKTIPATAFSPVTEQQILNRISDLEAKQKLVEVTLSDYGIDDGAIVPTGFNVGTGDEIAPAELFFDNVPMTLSRWPNKSFVGISELSTENTFKYGQETRPMNWMLNEDMWVRGYFVSSGWGDCTFRIEKINPETQEITTRETPAYGYNLTGRYFYFLNIIEEIDMPGEYYIDRSNHKLYFYPPYDLELASVKVSLSPNLLISGSELEYVNFKDIIFEGTRNSALDITHSSDHILIDSCVIRNVGRLGVLMNDVTHCTIQNSEIKYTGKGGIYFYGGDRENLLAAHIVSKNNHITEYNRIWKTYCSGITIAAGVGCQVENNLIHDSSHSAILFGGNDNLLDQNEIYDVTQETDDAGAIYSGRDYTYRGNVISNNFIHDGLSTVTFCGTTGIYLDDAMSSANVYNNIIAHFYHGFVLGGGRDHSISNNLILACDYSINFDDRNKELTHSELAGLETYIPYYQRNNWQAKYPSLFEMFQDENPGYPKGNSIEDNVFYHSGAMELAPLVTTYGQVTGNSNINSELNLMHLEKNQFARNILKPIYKELPNFDAIDFENIGLDYDQVTQTDNTFDMKMPYNHMKLAADAHIGVYFSWKELAYGDQYNIVISTDSDFRDIVVNEIVEENYVRVNSLKTNCTYYWKVVSLQNASSVPTTISCKTEWFTFKLLESPLK